MPPTYRPLFAHARFRRLLPALAASDLGDGMSVVAVAWLAVLIAPPGRSGPVVGAAVAAYALPGALGALVFGRLLRRLDPRRLVAVDGCLRAVLLGFGLGGMVYEPFTALSYILLQDRTPAARLTTVLATRGAALLAAAPVGTALGGPLVAAPGPRQVLAASGAATIALALVAMATRARGTRREGTRGART
ncbi:hypothetical protein [Streptomyces drozdowiczii]|uniref:MFS transporter n=1 Tax=Streptomyces drozdowiczii TaxID=202862 RepID=A0ABY6PNJ4_9ACTN|nr:hypothetical protein [Streptomyces drozdowiczii]MCX0246785.1 hypothetical protein [Streptomyces drozdowiczii]UZK53754.1 hypothetical protein NEH16_05955 [Streptomyces drozdowiczii]